MVTDPIADMLTRIRNGYRADLKAITVPASGLKRRVAEILEEEGYIQSQEFVTDSKQGNVKIRLKYDDDRSAITGIRRVSRPGRRVYVGAGEVPKVLNGIGTAILSTSSGVMTDRRAREAKVGGEVLCAVW
ncbi:MAG: 30S ribosomal protein S8 [Myxococcota bacterium]